MRQTNICASEWEDFRAVLTQRQRKSTKFETREYVEPIKGKGIQPLCGSITIRNRATDVKRTYGTGHNSIWVVEFSDDLAAGVL